MSIRENPAATAKAAMDQVAQSANYRVERGLDLGEAFVESCNPFADFAEGHDLGGRTVRAGQIADNILSYVVVGLVIIIGILVYSEVETSMPNPTNTELSDASSNATGDFASAMELAPLVILVGVAGLILFVVRRF